ncbi:tRNA-splicing endonuclease, putative [Entamoeba dispar SAW760]|uniref:tRNA-intron lyase n=1 Tax=Entamoeba dispar (strain ATCC PRA-260 / SAW760) TaxID=370354 RepID=B0EJK6_ENTDS|nr:tRNA-splicing endonuclease, putative [Entamoeba dispar SAW760]EDR25328.1 tRNA-splicing endonuclease, putative [Entamoeba dispar SAW760]|eukprot:EDR25328.1 tRNA-splicing endonuclease, putative [Entamoeba dispar SAW760]
MSSGDEFITIHNPVYIYQKHGIGKSLFKQKGINKNESISIITKIEYVYLNELNEILKEDRRNILLNENEKMKYHLYCELKKKGFFIKDGFKYGCDFVVYKKHPQCCHSYYGVLLMNIHQSLINNELIGLCRLLHNVKKHLLLCNYNNSLITMKEINWVSMENK